MRPIFSNNALATVATTTLSSTATTIVLSAGTGDQFPAPAAGQYTLLTIFEIDSTGKEITFEIVKLISRTADSLTVERNAESMVGAPHAYPSVNNPSGIIYVALRWTSDSANKTLYATDNLYGLDDKAASRANLGLGSAATYGVSNSGNNLPVMSVSNTWSGKQVFAAGASAVTLAAGNNSTEVATTAFVQNAVQNASPADGSVTTAKIATGAVVEDGLGVGAATLPKLDTSGANNSILAGNGSGLAPSWKTIQSLLNTTGSAPVYGCRAWVSFNGTGTVAINASGNVSSITDNGTGDYTINFSAAMPHANYALAGATQIDQSGNNQCGEFGIYRGSGYVPSASSVRVRTNNGAQTATDVLRANFSIFC